MIEKQPRISVFILTYNREHLVERSIKSVLNQTFQDYELILVDNGSTDNTATVFKKYKDLENVRAFKIEKNIGFARGYNYCLDQIRGEWFANVGDDDEIRPHALEALFKIVDEVDPELTAITSNGLDSATGENSGLGLYEDQYLPIKTIVEKCDGDFWGITKTELIKDKRINPRIPGLENTLWYKVDAEAKRYYTHQQLITYHTDHGVRETNSQVDDLDKKALLYRELLAEPFFWEVLKKYNRKQFRERCLKAMHFTKSKGDFKTFRIYAEMLKGDDPGVKQKAYSNLISLLSPFLLRQLYLLKQKVS